jgi:hypothetical protein
MNDAEFDGILARASDPNLIPGIYNYCNRRCERCAFTSRCFHYLETCRAISVECESLSLGQVVARSLEGSLDLLQIVGRRLGVDLIDRPDDVRAGDAAPAGEVPMDGHERGPLADPLIRIAREYASTTWPIVRALQPILQARGDAVLLEAMATLEAFSAGISAKVFRAVWTMTGDDVAPDRVQNEANGAAKIARLMIGEARQAWRTLMEPGQASSDGLPARLVKLLDRLDEGLKSRFPRAMDFVRPGFDTEIPSSRPSGFLTGGLATV